jgi:tRNA pseudouridine13 synthase
MRNTKPSQIFKASKSVRGVNLGDFKFSDQPLKLGSLNGNRFQIVLRFAFNAIFKSELQFYFCRNVCASDEDIEKSMKSLQEKGFLNYFGLQRFGTQSIPTYEIGKALVSGKWEEVSLISLVQFTKLPYIFVFFTGSGFDFEAKGWRLSQFDQRPESVAWDKKCCRGIQAVERQNGRRRISAQRLDEQSQKWSRQCTWSGMLGFFYLFTICWKFVSQIPRNTRLLYMHSYQSYIWNNVLSRRIKELGFKPVVGDLVVAEGAKLEELPEENVSEEPAEGTSGKKSFFSTFCNWLEGKFINLIDSSSSGNEPSKLPAVKVLTADDVSKYTIHDIVLPLPGFNVKYPENQCLEWFKEMFAKDGLTLESLKQSEK